MSRVPKDASRLPSWRRAPQASLDHAQSEMASEHYFESLIGRQLAGSTSDFVVVEWTDSGEPGHEWTAPLHVHHADDEAWYVLEGTMRFRIGDEIHEAGPQSAVMAPKGSPHTYGNARRGVTARYLLVMTPRIRALIDALHAPGADDYSAIFRAYDSELLA